VSSVATWLMESAMTFSDGQSEGAINNNSTIRSLPLDGPINCLITIDELLCPVCCYRDQSKLDRLR